MALKGLNKKLAAKGHRRHRLSIDILTLEETLWLVIGFLAGLIYSTGIKIHLIAILVVLILVAIYEQFRAKKTGLKTVTGHRAR